LERTRIQLADGVYLTYLPARKFKTSLLSAQFVTPLQQETASAYALLPAILRRGTVRYPDLGALSARLDRLYGASVDYTVRKQGENQCVGFVASFIDDSYIPGGEQLLEPLFTEDELAVFKRGRNASKASVAKHASPEEYRASTGFECLLGWLYLNGQLSRVHELFETLWQQFDPNET